MNRCPLITQAPNDVALLPPRFFGSVGYFATLAKFPVVVIDSQMRYNKRDKAVHRFAIATPGVNEPTRLTVPVSRPEGAFLKGDLRWGQVTVSPQARWWDVHRNTLAAVYGRTPFYEFYIDRLIDMWASRPRQECEFITDLDIASTKIAAAIMGLQTQFVTEDSLPQAAHICDLRRVDLDSVPTKKYWQLHQCDAADLSILDLIFNQGPEAALYLREIITK